MSTLWLIKSGGVSVAVVIADDAAGAISSLVVTTGGGVGSPWRRDVMTARRIGAADPEFASQTTSPIVLAEGWQMSSSACEAALLAASRAYAVDPRMVYGAGRRRHPSAVRARWAAWLVLVDVLHLSHGVCAGAVGVDQSTICDALVKARTLLKSGESEFVAAVAAAKAAARSFQQEKSKRRRRSAQVRSSMRAPAPVAARTTPSPTPAASAPTGM